VIRSSPEFITLTVAVLLHARKSGPPTSITLWLALPYLNTVTQLKRQ
jgi:hypothetical protein